MEVKIIRISSGISHQNNLEYKELLDRILLENSVCLLIKDLRKCVHTKNVYLICNIFSLFEIIFILEY